MGWSEVAEAMKDAKAIAFDGCHKIYVLMDDEQVEQTRGYGYDPLILAGDPEFGIETVQDWFDESCGLRFVSAVRTVEGDPNLGFTNLIAQFELDEEEDEEDEDEDEDL